MTIFVQIAAYRDSQLLHTIKDLLESAKYPGRLRIGICRQYHPDDGFDDLEAYKTDDRFRIIDVLYSASKGACWARNLIQQLYCGEDYTLQIDSHMRFAQHWDEKLIAMLTALQTSGYAKPLLTGYVADFNPRVSLNKDIEQPPRQMIFSNFTTKGIMCFKSQPMPCWQNLDSPIPARFYAAGCCFTIGEFCKEVQHDPDLYFFGEEISISVRAYTHGYDLFHPHKMLLWHQYIRDIRRHWEDNHHFSDIDTTAINRVRQLLHVDNESATIDFGKYGLGNVRTLTDYEQYAGISFIDRKVQAYTQENKFPPNPFALKGTDDWDSSFLMQYKCTAPAPADKFTETDYDLWAVCFYDELGNVLFRKDISSAEINKIISDKKSIYDIKCEFTAAKKPRQWSVIPHSLSIGWCKKVAGYLPVILN